VAELIPALLTGGLGAALGGIGTAVIQSFSGKGVSRAEAADRVTNAAGNLADRLDKEIARRDTEIQRMRKALSSLTEAIEDLLPMVQSQEIRTKTQAAIHEARLAFR
jgi:Skp family chaperone for outer membrane proteins